MTDFFAFSDEVQKIASDADKRERVRSAIQHAAAAALGAGVGSASADLLARYVHKHHRPQLARMMKSKSVRIGLPVALAGGAAYASNKYRKQLDEAYRRVRDEQ